MRHRRSGRKLGRTSSHRKALLRNLVTEFLDKERIVTTLPKAKELRPVAEKMITLGKREGLPARRRALATIRRKSVVHKLFDALGPRFADRNGGYTRIIRLGFRKGDNAELAMIELVEAEQKEAPEAPKKKERKTRKAKAEKSKSGTAAKAKTAAKEKPAEKAEAKTKTRKTRSRKKSEEESAEAKPAKKPRSRKKKSDEKEG